MQGLKIDAAYNGASKKKNGFEKLSPLYQNIQEQDFLLIG